MNARKPKWCQKTWALKYIINQCAWGVCLRKTRAIHVCRMLPSWWSEQSTLYNRMEVSQTSDHLISWRPTTATFIISHLSSNSLALPSSRRVRTSSVPSTPTLSFPLMPSPFHLYQSFWSLQDFAGWRLKGPCHQPFLARLPTWRAEPLTLLSTVFRRGKIINNAIAKIPHPLARQAFGRQLADPIQKTSRTLLPATVFSDLISHSSSFLRESPAIGIGDQTYFVSTCVHHIHIMLSSSDVCDITNFMILRFYRRLPHPDESATVGQRLFILQRIPAYFAVNILSP